MISSLQLKQRQAYFEANWNGNKNHLTPQKAKFDKSSLCFGALPLGNKGENSKLTTGRR
jgi:hypothetical protein